jgi:hypothetical protein
MRRLNSIIILAAVAVVAFAVPASAETSQWPTFLKGSLTGSRHDFNAEVPAGQYFMDFCAPVSSCPMPNPAYPSSSYTDRWQIPNLKLKRERVKVMRTQIQVVYKIVGGTVTWSHEGDTCRGPVSFTETLSLKGVKWDRDSRITFFAPKNGRFKNRWRVDGQLDGPHDKVLGPCPAPADPNFMAFVSLPSLLSGTRVGGTPPIARPGKTVRLGDDTHHVKNNPLTGYEGFTDLKDMLTIRVPRL